MTEFLRERGLDHDEAHRATLSAWATSHGIVTILLDRQDSPLVASRRPPPEIAEGIVDVLIGGLAAMKPAQS